MQRIFIIIYDRCHYRTGEFRDKYWFSYCHFGLMDIRLKQGQGWKYQGSICPQTYKKNFSHSPLGREKVAAWGTTTMHPDLCLLSLYEGQCQLGWIKKRLLTGKGFSWVFKHEQRLNREKGISGRAGRSQKYRPE